MSRNFLIGAVITSIMAALALISLVWTPYDVTLLNIPEKLQKPGGAHLLGTDHLGRDILSMTMTGLRTSIAIAALAIAVGLALGVPLGLAAAANVRRRRR